MLVDWPALDGISDFPETQSLQSQLSAICFSNRKLLYLTSIVYGTILYLTVTRTYLASLHTSATGHQTCSYVGEVIELLVHHHTIKFVEAHKFHFFL